MEHRAKAVPIPMVPALAELVLDVHQRRSLDGEATTRCRPSSPRFQAGQLACDDDVTNLEHHHERDGTSDPVRRVVAGWQLGHAGAQPHGCTLPLAESDTPRGTFPDTPDCASSCSADRGKIQLPMSLDDLRVRQHAKSCQIRVALGGRFGVVLEARKPE